MSAVVNPAALAAGADDFKSGGQVRRGRHAWLQLLRPPNLFTVPGDPLAGFFFCSALLSGAASAGHVVLPVLAVLLIYMGGLIGNDVADYEEDRRDRPARPIPSGCISRRAAFVASAGCALVGLVLAYCAGWSVFWMAGITQGAVMLYNGGLKRYTFVGAVIMGACRGCSFLVGAMAAHPRAYLAVPVLTAATGVTLYIAAITWLADRETVEERLGFRRWAPVVALLVMFVAVAALVRPVPLPFELLGLTAMGWAFYHGWRLKGVPRTRLLGASIGCLIRGLLLIQAAFVVFGSVSEGRLVAAVLLICWPVSAAVGKWFYAT